MPVNLSDRERTHGLFKDTATTSQSIRTEFHASKNWEKLSDVQREALEMLAVKLARVLNGNFNHKDHWDDIAGYAQLASESIKNSLPHIENSIAQSFKPNGAVGAD